MAEIFELMLRFLFRVSGALVTISLAICEQLQRLSKSGETTLREARARAFSKSAQHMAGLGDHPISRMIE